MRIMIIIPSASRHGGAEAALLHLVEKRFEAGLTLLVCFLEHGEMVQNVSESGVTVRVIEAGRLRSVISFKKTVRRLHDLIGQWRPDAVLSWMTKAHIYGGLAARGTGVPAYYFQMGLPDGGIVDKLSRWVPASGALGCSGFVASEQRKWVSHPVLSVPLAFDVGAIGDLPKAIDMKTKLGFDPNRPLVGIVGRLQHWKGMHVYLQAMANVVKQVPLAQGVIVGGPHEQEAAYPKELVRIRSELGLDKVVQLAGKQTNVPEWMQAMDVVVHASCREPFGIVVIEAMALGKPVVATRPGGPEEIIKSGSTGVLVPWNNADMQAKAIIRYLEQPGWAHKIAAAAAERSEEFTTQRYAIRLGEAMRTLLSLNRQHATR